MTLLFCVFTVATCEIGFLTPPVGANLNVASRLTTATFEQISLSVLPFLASYIIVMFLIVVFPNLALWIPNFFRRALSYRSEIFLIKLHRPESFEQSVYTCLLLILMKAEEI